MKVDPAALLCSNIKYFVLEGSKRYLTLDSKFIGQYVGIFV